MRFWPLRRSNIYGFEITMMEPGGELRSTWSGCAWGSICVWILTVVNGCGNNRYASPNPFSSFVLFAFNFHVHICSCYVSGFRDIESETVKGFQRERERETWTVTIREKRVKSLRFNPFSMLYGSLFTFSL